MPYSHSVHASAQTYAHATRQIGSNPKINDVELAACKDTSLQNRTAACSCSSIHPFDTGPKRSMGHLLGGEKIIFLIRDIDGPAMAAAPVESCQDRGPEVSLGSPRIGTRRGQSPTPHTRALRSVDTYQYRFSARRRA